MDSTTDPVRNLASELQQFTGCDQVYQHSLVRKLVYTEGIRYLCEKTKSFWLLDAVASYFASSEMMKAIDKDPRLKDFQVWTIAVKEDRSASITMRADSDTPPAITQDINWTDFPLDEVRMWVGFDGSRWTLYLPSEH